MNFYRLKLNFLSNLTKERGMYVNLFNFRVVSEDTFGPINVTI